MPLSDYASRRRSVSVRRQSVFKSINVRRMHERRNETVKGAGESKGLTYKGQRKRQRSTVDVATYTFERKCGETSPRGTVYVLPLIRHLGRHRRVVSLFAEAIFNSSLGGLCTSQTSDIDIRHRHLWSRSIW